jgi:hypothetical protein
MVVLAFFGYSFSNSQFWLNIFYFIFDLKLFKMKSKVKSQLSEIFIFTIMLVIMKIAFLNY